MVSITPFFSNFFSFFIILLLHLGCFIFSFPRHGHDHDHDHHRRHHLSSSSFKKKYLTSPKRNISSFLKRLFSSSSSSIPISQPPSIPSPSSSTRSLRLFNPPTIIPNIPTEEFPNHPLVNSNHSLVSQNDIYPCSVCGEIFQKPTLLDHHQSLKHAVSEVIDSENIVRIIFKMGWPDKGKIPVIHRILKIYNSSKILGQFEEYREFVKSKAAAKSSKGLRDDQRCIADGNELLRFHCTTFLCHLDSSICNQQYCSACGIIRGGFSTKMDGISTLPTSWTAHMALPEDIEEEFKFMHVKRALLVCRVIAGRIGCDPGIADKEDPGFDSLVGRGSGGFEEELLVYNPKAVLPCFVILYTV